MTIAVDVRYSDGTSDHVVPSTSALDTVRASFNPSELKSVRRVKALAAALITECEKMRSDGRSDGRQAHHAIIYTETASMYATKACTTAAAVKHETELRDYAAEHSERPYLDPDDVL